MGYADYLRHMLAPLGIYNLRSGYGFAETEAVGAALDDAEMPIAAMLDTPTGENLKNLEALFSIMQFDESEEERVTAVRTLLSTDDSCASIDKLENQLSACGLDAELAETENRFVVNVIMQNIRGELSDEEAAVCKAIMPAHLQLNFICSGVTWDRIEALYPTWDEFDAAGITISEMMELE